MAKKIVNFNEVSSYYNSMLEQVRTQIHDSIRAIVKSMGGNICTRWYHNERDCTRYAFFDMNNDGYGVELFAERVFIKNDEVCVELRDSEDGYDYEWELADFNASNSLYLLQELEEIAQCANDEGEEIRKEYDEDED